jgi:ubiquinone/menaquinone biosynthesis C-methylase UbiE
MQPAIVQALDQERSTSTPFTIWETSGLTEHLGGIPATRRLLERCRITSGQRVLDLGCGTGYTASLLSQRCHTQITALDINRTLIATARRRAARAEQGGRVNLLQADAHAVPTAASAFDVVIVESLLVFCDLATVLAEIHRVLRPAGIVGLNELTLRRPAPAQLHALLEETLHIHPRTEQEWHTAFSAARFAVITASVHAIRLRDQLASHIVVDGLHAYLTAVRRGIADPTIRRVFCTPAMLEAARQFLPYVGYGIYVVKKT